MASYTRRYPNTGSTLTINYPDGLFSDIVEDPRTLYRVSQEDELYYTPYDLDDQGNKIYKTDKDYGRQAYPDLILIPANGSFINEHADMDEITTVRSFRKNDNGVWEKTDERKYETHKKADGDYYYISIYGVNQLWFRGSPITLIDNRCYSCGEISIRESMEANEIDYCVPSDLSERYAYDTRETHITITIYGEARFFKSNATHYFCEGTSETNGTLYCNSYFGEDKKVVGGFHIRDKDKKIIEFRPVSLTNRGGRGSRYYACKGSNGETRVLDFSNCHECYDYDGVVVPYQDSSDQDLNYEDCFCEGFRFQRGLNQFWGKNLEIDGKPLFSEEQLTYRNSNIQFILEPIVAVSTGYAPQGWGTYLYLEPQGMETKPDAQGNEVLAEKQPSIEVELNVDYDDENSFFSGMKVWDNYKWDDDETIFYIIPFNEYTDYRRGNSKWATKYVFMPLSSFQCMGERINYIYGYGNSVGFSGYFTTCAGYTTPNQYLVAPWKDDNTQNVDKNIPLYEYGVTLYPVMTKPQCIYMKLNTDKALDKDNLFGNFTKNHNKIISSLEKTYGKNYIERNITEWNENTLKNELWRLIDSTCKFKILYINCHGGFWKDPQRSYAVLSDVGKGSNYFTKGALDCLLKNRREDEFYFIHFASCFSGGLVEETNHTNVDAEDYTWIVPDPNLGDGCLLWYSDCSNSPAWGYVGGDGVCDLFKFNDLKTYKEQADDINSSINRCRAKNIQYLVDFLQRHYTFLKDTFLDGTALNWTEETYNKSITNAPNLIIRLSKEREKNTITDADGTKRKEINPEYTKLLKQYPIMLLFHILFKLNNYSNISKLLKPVKKSNFMNTSRGYLHYINDVKEILDTHSIAVNYLDEEHDFLFDTDIWEEDDADFKKDASKKELLENYINFFYDLYVLMSNILKQSQEIYDTNSFGEYNDILNSLIDDIPGVVVYGEEFGQCKFPKFPGFNELYDCISEESLNKILYKYNGGDSQ